MQNKPTKKKKKAEVKWEKNVCLQLIQKMRKSLEGSE